MPYHATMRPWMGSRVRRVAAPVVLLASLTMLLCVAVAPAGTAHALPSADSTTVGTRVGTTSAAAAVAAAPAVITTVTLADGDTADDADITTNTTTDYDTWTAVADDIAAQLKDGVDTYATDRPSASSVISPAYNMTYRAGYFAAAVADVLGADAQQALADRFQSVLQLTYADGNADELAAQVVDLTTALADAAATLDASADLKNPRDYAAASLAETQSQRDDLQANKKTTYTGRGDRTWGDVAADMDDILDEAVAIAKGGDGQGGADTVNEAYYQYYERLGFEKNVMNAIGGSRVSLVESTFKDARKAMVAGKPAAETASIVDSLKTMLDEDAARLDGGAADRVDGFTRFVTSAVGQSFLVLVREGLEALLVVAATVAYLVKSGNRRFVGWIYAGVAAGLAGSGVVAALFVALFGGSGPVQEIMEGVCALIAMGMLLWTSNWMLNKSSVEAWNRYIRSKTEAAVADASAAAAGGAASARTVGSLALLSFLAVFREGAETVIFYQSIYSMTQDAHGMWVGGLLAAAVLLVVFMLIRFTSVRIPIGPFFLVTSILMSALVVVFAGGGVHSLIEGDLLPGLYLNGLPTNDWLGFYPYAETVVAQIVAAVAVLTLFAVGYVRQRRAKTVAATTVSAAASAEAETA